MTAFKKSAGFAVIEILIVGVILAIVSWYLVMLMRDTPKKSRDALRLSDMANLFQAVQTTVVNNEGGKDQLYYILCSQVKTPCQGTSFPVEKTTRKIDGTGWLKLQFTSKEILRYNFLPLDPLNNAEFNYSYFSDGKSWKLETKLEHPSFKQKMAEDGGSDPNKYELKQTIK